VVLRGPQTLFSSSAANRPHLSGIDLLTMRLSLATMALSTALAGRTARVSTQKCKEYTLKQENRAMALFSY
jgi:hypothetical protein